MDIFFKSWDSVLRVLITLLFIYPGLIVLLRLSGKRSLSKLNMFDFIITIALGSTFASVVIQANVTITDGLITFALFLLAQYLITWASVHLSFVNHLIKAEPTMVFHDGDLLKDAMQSVRVTEQEIMAEIRQAGFASLDDVHAVVLETNGVMSVLRRKEQINNSTLQTVSNYVME